ncbi:hypothetical protein [Adhaeribacter radiodurans]|uniref:STAS/SEC14 domain-containing protein n=1 Tax=Adhaeribacter radiodurans TaxID=2745197 RepID=A0A7L7LEQ1_9BACT|nr:hypothetical protein [Adhaeribacter radiodurans]QMU30869.1 hypothetical protein HUW48_23820 [Adhaeribacter radiodurans]
MIVFEKNNIELEVHPQFKIMEVRWMGVLEEEELKIMIHKIVEVANKYAIENILLDATYVEASKSIAIYDVRVQQHFQQKFAMPTVKKIARVSSGFASYDEAISQHYNTLLQYNPANFEFRNFNHHYEAMDWIIGR